MKHTVLELGKVVNTHGIRGEVKIQPWCDDAAVFDTLSHCNIGEKEYRFLRCRPHKNCIIAQLEGVESIEEAELLRNQILTVKREQLGELPEGTYYIADLEGLEVRTADGTVLGNIAEVIKTGSNDVYVLDNDKRKPILIPVIDRVVKEVNPEAGFVTVELMEGLVD